MNESPNRWPLLAIAMVAIIITLILTATLSRLLSEDGDEAPAPEVEVSTPDMGVIERAEAFYASRAPYERPRPYSEVPEGLGDTSAETCGACHEQIYQEWALSTHRRAWLDDAQFQEELSKSRGEKDPNTGDVGWLCVNCHTPTVPQLEHLVVGLEGGQINKPIYEENPLFEERLQREAITCATCHVRDGAIQGPYGDTNAPHATAKDESLLDERVCTSCHQAEARYPTQNLQCFFGTGREWAASSYAERGETCQSCHMPVVERKVAEHFDVPVRKTRRHWFGGSLIPKKPEFAEELAPLREVYGSGVTLELLAAGEDAPPEAPRPPALESAPEVIGCGGEQPCTALRVRVRNDRAGHYMPSGDPERHITVLVEARGEGGEVLARSWDLIGSRYKWWPEIELVEDTRIPPEGHRDVWLLVPARGAFTVEVTADKWRMYEEAFEHHHLEGKYVRGRRFHRSVWRVDRKGAPALERIEDDFGAREVLEP